MFSEPLLVRGQVLLFHLFRQLVLHLLTASIHDKVTSTLSQGCGSALISVGSGSSILGWIPIRIQSGSRALMTKNWTKLQLKKKILVGSKATIYLSLGLHKERPSYRRSLQLSTEAIQHFKTWTFTIFFYFCGSFLPSWTRIRNPAVSDTDWSWIPLGLLMQEGKNPKWLVWKIRSPLRAGGFFKTSNP